MSIVPLRHLTLLGMAADKAAVVARLQDLGFLHLRPLRPEDALPREVGGGPSPEARQALAFLLASPWQRRHRTRAEGFDAEALQAEALRLKERLRVLEDERDFLTVRIRNLEPWGDFEFGTVDEMGGQRLWFYQIPLYQLGRVPAHLPVQIIRRDHRFAYLVVVTPEEPTDMPLPQPGEEPRVRNMAIGEADLQHILERHGYKSGMPRTREFPERWGKAVEGPIEAGLWDPATQRTIWPDRSADTVFIRALYDQVVLRIVLTRVSERSGWWDVITAHPISGTGVFYNHPDRGRIEYPLNLDDLTRTIE